MRGHNIWRLFYFNICESFNFSNGRSWHACSKRRAWSASSRMNRFLFLLFHHKSAGRCGLRCHLSLQAFLEIPTVVFSHQLLQLLIIVTFLNSLVILVSHWWLRCRDSLCSSNLSAISIPLIIGILLIPLIKCLQYGIARTIEWLLISLPGPVSKPIELLILLYIVVLSGTVLVLL